jgi:ribosomal-protein-alanine N-acetyltransferase
VSVEPALRTPRLLLRPWRPEDLEPCAAMNAEPAVVEHLPRPYSPTQSAGFILAMQRSFSDLRYGLWVLELVDEAPFIGCAGLLEVRDELPFAPAVELGWRLARPWWGRGLATEAATAAVAYAFEDLGLDALVAYTARRNERSRRLMERLGMRRDPAEDFLHPAVGRSDPLAPHVLYRLEAA